MDSVLEEKRARQREYSRLWRERNREKSRSVQAAYCERNRELHRERARVWRADNPERARENYRRWRSANPERARELTRQWYADNPDKSADKAARRRAQTRGALSVEKVDRAAIIERDRSTCHLCGELVPADDIHLDHIVPLALGGDHTAANLAVAHSLCNLRKGARIHSDPRT